jgi:iron complex transport system ATP-binding protein
MSFFEIKDLSVSYGKKKILENLSLSVEKGSLNGILGENGCGKTTALKAICGILPHDGTCMLDGVRLEGLSPRKIAQKCSYIPQRSGISIDLSALEVVLMGLNPHLRLLEQPNGAMQQKAVDILTTVGLAGREHDNFLLLSEGQKQLCILARTLLSDGTLLLLDEPESALDFHYRYQMLDVLQKWVSRAEKTALLTLHDGNLALNYCDRLFLLGNGSLLGTIFPKTDPIDKMEELLSQIYGKISLQKCLDRKGNAHLILLKETE